MEKKTTMLETMLTIKNGLINEIVKTIGERTIDVSEEGVTVSAVEHHCNEGLFGEIIEMSASGFKLQWDACELPWKDMVVEDLAMVYDYLTTGRWG